MRGVMVFMTALFVLAPYYVIMTMAFEPLAQIILDFNLSAVNGASSIQTLRNVLYLWGPAVYVTGWFVWAVRYYMSRNLFLGSRGPAR
jgi:hypothetical protein